MADLTDSTIERACQDLLSLRQALTDLTCALGAKEETKPYPGAAAGQEYGRVSNPPLQGEGDAAQRISQIGSLLAQLNDFMDKLRATLELQRKEQEYLQGLCKIGGAVNSILDLHALLDLVMDTMIEVMGAERGFLLLFDPSGKELAAAVARNMDGSTIQGADFGARSSRGISRSIIARVAREGIPILTTNAQADPRFAGRESIVNYQLRSVVCVPLRVKEKITGVIYVDNRFREGVFAPADRDLMASFADQAAIGIENARLFSDLQAKMVEIANMKNYMDNIFASIASGVITIDTSGLITTFNHAAEQMLGIAAQEALRRPCVEVLRGLVNFPLCQSLEKVYQERYRFVGQEVEAVLEGGRKACLSLSLSPLLDGKGNSLGVALVMDDLTERKRLEAQREAEERERKRIHDIFQRYVAPTVVERILSDPSQIALGGRQSEVSILFADIRGFSLFSEKTPPEELVDLLNQHLALAVQAILQEEGTLDKYMGDSVLAVFNAPLPQADHALRAVRAALAMQQAIARHHQTLVGSPGFSFGVGVNVGNTVVGNIGAPQMMNYTVIGDAVNLAKRLQENAAPGQILLSAELYRRLQHLVLARSLSPLKVKGHAEPELVYELLGLRDQTADERVKGPSLQGKPLLEPVV